MSVIHKLHCAVFNFFVYLHISVTWILIGWSIAMHLYECTKYMKLKVSWRSKRGTLGTKTKMPKALKGEASGSGMSIPFLACYTPTIFDSFMHQHQTGINYEQHHKASDYSWGHGPKLGAHCLPPATVGVAHAAAVLPLPVPLLYCLLLSVFCHCKWWLQIDFQLPVDMSSFLKFSWNFV